MGSTRRISKWQNIISSFMPHRVEHCESCVWYAEDESGHSLMLVTGDGKSRDYFSSLSEFTAAALYLFLEVEDKPGPEGFKAKALCIELEKTDPKGYFPSLQESLAVLGSEKELGFELVPLRSYSLFRGDKFIGLSAETDDYYQAYFWQEGSC